MVSSPVSAMIAPAAVLDAPQRAAGAHRRLRIATG